MRTILSFFLLMSFFFTACEFNYCKIADCGENAICDNIEKECQCIGGYLKDANGKCTLRNIYRDAFVDTFLVTEQGIGAHPNTFVVRVLANDGVENVNIYGHAAYTCGLGQELSAISIPGTVSATGLSFGDYQRNCGGMLYIFRGFTTTWINSGVFTAAYKVETQTGVVKDVTATFVKM